MSNPAIKNPNTTNLPRPDIFVYMEYKTFLRDYLHYLKISDPEFSIRTLASTANISVGYISTILKSAHEISPKVSEKLIPFLRFSREEAAYFRILTTITANASNEEKLWAVKRLNKFKKFSKCNPNEVLVTNYFSKWYNIVIREMANQKGFRLDPLWIQRRLNFAVSLADISRAVEFLLYNKLIRVKPDGTFAASEEHLECNGEIYRFILTHFYKRAFELAGESIDNVPREKRNLRSHTLNLAPERFEAAREILDRAHKELSELSNEGTKDSAVYQFLLAGFPYTSPSEDDK